MAISTPLMVEILQHFARVFPMPGRIDGREDYLALVKTWSDQLEPYTDEQVKEACRRLMGKLKRFPYPSDVRDELAPESSAPAVAAESPVETQVLTKLVAEVDTTQVGAALVRVGQFREALPSPCSIASALKLLLEMDGSPRVSQSEQFVQSLRGFVEDLRRKHEQSPAV